MTPYYVDDWLTVYGGDCREVMAGMDAESVHCVVTSPPYWGLRDYGVEGQLGLEPTPEEYVANLVDVFREVRRVLRADGTVWLNLGDSYYTTPAGNRTPSGISQATPKRLDRLAEYNTQPKTFPGLKPKDLVGIPWRVAFALQADGWYLRSDIIWAKPNPMPESVTDRPTKAHEYLFLLAKGQWKARVVHAANGKGEGLHLGSDLRPTSAPVRLADADFCVRIASAILDVPESQEKLSLSSLDAEVREQGAADLNSADIGGLPVAHRATLLAARLFNADASPKEFLQELQSLGIALTERNHLLIGGLESEVPLPPGLTRYGETAVAIHYPGEVRQLDLVHGTIITSTPSTCSYYFDAEAVREPDAGTDHPRLVLTGQPSLEPSGGIAGAHGGIRTIDGRNGSGRNIRSVWTVATQPYPGAHFAVFPEKLVEPCILAGTSERGVCPECGAPWVRVVDASKYEPPIVEVGVRNVDASRGDKVRKLSGADYNEQVRRTTTGWRPSCAHTYCADCYNASDAATVGSLPAVREDVRAEGSSSDGQVLLQGVRVSPRRQGASDDAGLRGLIEGLRPPLPTGPPDGHEDGVPSGASASDGGSTRPEPDSRGSRRSHQRDQGRQSPGESAGSDEEGARRDLEPGQDADGDMPGLRESLPAQGTCRQCGATLQPLAPVAAVVLDCFAGSGTVGRVANRLSRRAVLIDLNPDYLTQQMARNRDIPLGLGA